MTRKWILLKEAERKGGVDPVNKGARAVPGLAAFFCVFLYRASNRQSSPSPVNSPPSQKKQTEHSLLRVLRVWSNEPIPVKRKSNLFWEVMAPLTLKASPRMTSERSHYQFPFWNSLLELSGAKMFDENWQLFRSSTFPKVTTPGLWVLAPH